MHYYCNIMKPTLIKDLLTSAPDGRDVTVCGWVRTKRDSKNLVFIQVNDGSCFANIQLTFDRSNPQGANSENIENELKRINTGASIRAEGKIIPSPASGQAVEVTLMNLTVLGECNPEEYPLQKNKMSMEYLRENATLRARTNTFGAVFRVRNQMAFAVHSFFQERGFQYINTPEITCSDCEGAGEMFQVTTIGYSKDYKNEEEYYANDFFGKRAGLSVSGQLEGEMAAMAMGKIYTFGPSFRAENSNTPKHLAEFWHVEPEVAFAELDDVIEIAENMLKYVIRKLLDTCPDDMKFFDAHFEKGLIARLEELISHDFARVTYTEAIDLLKKSGENFVYPVEWGCDLQTEHERYLSEKVFKKAVFVTDYPKEIKSFYMKQNPDGKTVAAVDLLVPGVGEIIGGSEREADYEKLIAAMNERKMNLDLYSDYLDLRKFGSVPHGGFGLGFERLIMYTTGMANIRDVILFPRTVGSIR